MMMMVYGYDDFTLLLSVQLAINYSGVRRFPFSHHGPNLRVKTGCMNVW